MMNYLEIAGALTGVLYLYLEYRVNAWLWVVSVIMPAIYLVVYYEAGLYADFGISVYYIFASVYGLICWIRKRGKIKNTTVIEPDISSMPKSIYLNLTVVFVILFASIWYILDSFTDSSVAMPDAFTTALSIIAMWMLARKYVEQWLVWIVADVVCVVLYLYKDLWFTAGLYLAYAVIAIFGYRKWKRIMLKE